MVLVCGFVFGFCWCFLLPGSANFSLSLCKSIVGLKSLSGLKAFDYDTEAHKKSTSTV